jgi:hypothetical protein
MHVNLTSRLVRFRKPGLFQAGVAGAPAVDARFFGTDDIALMGLPHTDPEVYHRISAIHDAEALQDHLLIIHGMQDNVVPFKTSVMLAEKLILLGKNFDFAFAPGAGHGWSRGEQWRGSSTTSWSSISTAISGMSWFRLPALFLLETSEAETKKGSKKLKELQLTSVLSTNVQITFQVEREGVSSRSH